MYVIIKTLTRMVGHTLKLKNKIGPRNYTCLLLHEKRDIKRHVDQIRDGETETTVGDELPLNQDDSQGSEQAHEAATNDTEMIANTSNDDDDDVQIVEFQQDDQDQLDESIPDVRERPHKRRVAQHAQEKIQKIFQRRNSRR